MYLSIYIFLNWGSLGGLAAFPTQECHCPLRVEALTDDLKTMLERTFDENINLTVLQQI